MSDIDIETTASEPGRKTCEFRAEVRKVLQILTNSLYTNREIFLRELVSNASDALDKLRFRQSRGETPREPDLPLEISISLDADKKVLTIADTGIGMSEQELADNLGIIARSGSEDFLAELAKQSGGEEGQKADASQIIGRFGVGFYSVFMVASRVQVISREAFGDGAAHVWESDGLGSYTIGESDAAEPARGTKIVVYLKEDAAEYAQKYRVEAVIKKHSAFVPFPVQVDGSKVNTQPALWREPKSQVTKEQYNEFYKAFTYDAADPIDHLHISADVPVQFNALIYFPDSRQDYFGAEQDHWGLDLYSRRVLIQHQNKDLLPEYLAFMKGVVDTEDLPLNISRETLQENVVLRKIKTTLVKQSLGHLEKMVKDRPDDYAKFWKHHGRIFKLGYQDFANRDRVAGLMRFNSSALDKGEDLTSLEEYQSRALEGQKTFWYVGAPNREAARLNPHMGLFRKKGIEVLYFYEPIDEFVAEGMGTWKDWNFKAVETATEKDLEAFPDKETEEKKSAPLSEDESRTLGDLLKKMKEILGDKVDGVVVSTRLADSPACLVSKDGVTSSMEKFMRAMQRDETVPVKTLEVNKDHALVRTMMRIFKADADDATLASMVQYLFDGALLMDGYVKDPQEVASRAADLLEKAAAWYVEVRKL